MKKILFPVKGTLHDLKASEVVGLLAMETRARVTYLHVRIEGAPILPEHEALSEKIKNKLLELYAVEVTDLSVTAKVVSDAILAEAKKGYDYLVLGAREDPAAGSGEGAIAGKTVKEVFKNSPAPVIIVKQVLSGGGVPPMKGKPATGA